jgi:putative transposase
MTEDRPPLAELLQKAGDGDFLRAVAEAVLQLVMESDVEGLIGAGRHERSPERLNYRNGYRDRALDTRLGTLQLRVPKLRQGSYFPPFLEPRKVSEKALVAVIQEAWIGGVSTRRVDELVQAMGLSGISRSTVSKLCKDTSTRRVGAFLERPLAGEWPYLWLDATYLKVREGGRIVAVAAIIAVAVDTEGRREIVGLHLGPSEAETFWSTFLKGLLRRGLRGVKLVISDAHEGLKAAIRRVLGATWQRCRVHWMRGALAYVPKGQQTMVAAARCARRSCRPTGPARTRSGGRSPTSSGRAGPSSRPSWTRASTRSWPTWASRPSTAPSCTPRTRSNASTRR